MLERPSLEKFVGARIKSYLVEQLMEQSELGALYTARETVHGTQYVLAILSIPLGTEVTGQPSVSNSSAIFDTLANQASAIAALQHPYILPLVDYGAVGDLPYLVWPDVPSRALSTRLSQGGSLDLLTIGRYLDQIAAALEYAHEHLVLHRSLTIDSLSLQRDGRISVHDFGIRRMLEQGRKDAEWYALRNWNEACAPEQILGLATNPATDVYALGIVLYQLLTGEPPYAGARRKDIMQQHLQIPIPPLRLRRPDLPGELDNIVAAATAKQASDRLSRPGILANAYHDVVSPQQSGRVPFKINTSAIMNGPYTNSKVGLDGALPQATRPNPGYGPTGEPPGALPPIPHNRNSHSEVAQLAPAPSSSFRPLRSLLFAAVIIALILGTVVTVNRLRAASAPAPSGQVSFMDSSAQTIGQTNALSIQIANLLVPPDGSAYYAWLVNRQSERVLALGTLNRNGQTYSLSYQSLGPTAAEPGINLLTLGTLLEITLEQGNVLLPTGTVVLSGTFPPESFVHVGHLLISYPDAPGKIGLLVGAETQTQLLLAEVQALQAAAAQNNVSEIQCETQSILDIIQGSAGPQYHPLADACAGQHTGAAGDGFGLLGTESATYHTLTGYLATAAEHAAYAATEPDATHNLRTHAHNVELDIANVEGWVATMQQDALHLQQSPQDKAMVPAIVTLAGDAWYGVNSTGNNQTGSVAAKAGMLTAFSEGQQMATLTLVS